MSSMQRHGEAATSAALAASLCFAITQLIGLTFFPDAIPHTLQYGFSISGVAFGGCYAGVFFIGGAIAARKQRAHQASV